MVAKQFDKAMEAYRKAFELYYSGKDTSNYGRRLKGEVRKVVYDPASKELSVLSTCGKTNRTEQIR